MMLASLEFLGVVAFENKSWASWYTQKDNDMNQGEVLIKREMVELAGT
jgi:hypothetical protein